MYRVTSLRSLYARELQLAPFCLLKLSPHLGASIRSKSTRLTRSGVTRIPHFGQATKRRNGFVVDDSAILAMSLFTEAYNPPDAGRWKRSLISCGS